MNLDEDMLILGAPKVELVLQSASKGMVATRLCAVSPEGISHRISYGLKNLAEIEGSVATIEMDYICYRLPVGYKLRVSLSREYWPIAWPSTQLEPLRFSMESCFHFSWTQMSADDVTKALQIGKTLPPTSVHLPEPPSTTQRIDNGHASRKTKTLSDGSVEVTDIDDRGCRIFTYEDGKELEWSSKASEKIGKSASSASHLVEWSTMQKFDNQVAEARLVVSMESTQEGAKSIVSSVSALHDGHVIFDKQWRHVI
eukprot:TRINITY_DN1133_c0_g1_i4.p3 TRINITY_DN1133_c0_g1~~TRINITY_DN1133_c0_g1_i4.p3  ORF type:complete len:256 (-),score=23.47 TRINITY_DN1133_c0_g1_i4:467-1234(-)